MKIRTGFVSNSSTSSFLVYGAESEGEILFDALKNMGPLQEDSTDLSEWVWGEGDKVLKENGLKIEWPYGGDYGVTIGRSWDQVGDDETGKQFKESIEAAIKKVFGIDLECSTHEAAWRDG